MSQVRYSLFSSTNWEPDNAALADVAGAAVVTVLESDWFTLTHAQILNLPNVAIEVLPAPGAGTIYVFINAILVGDTTEGYYEWEFDQGSNIHFVVGQVQVSLPVHESNNMLGALLGIEDVYVMFIGPQVETGLVATVATSMAPEGGVSEDVVGNSLRIAATNIDEAFASQPFSGGHADNTLRVKVWYAVIDMED